MAGAGPGTDVQLSQVPRCLRSPGPQILKKRNGDMPDTRPGPGDTAVNIPGKACLQGTFVEMGKGEHIIDKLGTFLVVVRIRPGKQRIMGWGEGQCYK